MGRDDKQIEQLRSVCQVSEERARELIEAVNGDLERAIDIHLQNADCKDSEGGRLDGIDHDEREKVDAVDAPMDKGDPPVKQKGRKTTTRNHSLKRQQKLDNFFLSGSNPKSSRPKQRKLDSFLIPKQRSTPDAPAARIDVDDTESEIPSHITTEDFKRSKAIPCGSQSLKAPCRVRKKRIHWACPGYARHQNGYILALFASLRHWFELV